MTRKNMQASDVKHGFTTTSDGIRIAFQVAPYYLAEAKVLEGKIENARRMVVPGAGHPMQVQNPEQFEAELMTFVSWGRVRPHRVDCSIETY